MTQTSLAQTKLSIRPLKKNLPDPDLNSALSEIILIRRFSRYGLISGHPDFIIANQGINGVVVTWVVAILEIRLDPPGVRFPLNACFFPWSLRFV